MHMPNIEPPASFNGELFSYQVDGYRWLFRLSKQFVGGLLADEMGLDSELAARAADLDSLERTGQIPGSLRFEHVGGSNILAEGFC